VGTALVCGGWSSLTRKPPLFCRSPEPRDDPDAATACLLLEVVSGPPYPLHRIQGNPPPIGQITDVNIGDELVFVVTGSRAHYQLGTGRPRELIPPTWLNPMYTSAVIVTVPAPKASVSARMAMSDTR